MIPLIINLSIELSMMCLSNSKIKKYIPDIVDRCDYFWAFVKSANDLQFMYAISECYEQYHILKKK